MTMNITVTAGQPFTESFFPFSDIRKMLIQHLKSFLMDPENRPYRDEEGIKHQALYIQDYAVYAALRGADYKKVSHMANGENARIALKHVVDQLDAVKVIQPNAGQNKNRSKRHPVNRYLPEGATPEMLSELRTILVDVL
ncbi:hypothetical protein ACI2KR_09065 [Pseudomonas luteola]